MNETFIRHNFFNMLKGFRRTRLIATVANVHKRIHTNSTTMDDEHILMGTNFSQVLFASTHKLTSVVVRLCVSWRRWLFVYVWVDVGGCLSMCELTSVVVCLCVSWRRWLFVYVWVDVSGCLSMCELMSVVVLLCVSWRRGCLSMCELTSVVVCLCVSWLRWLFVYVWVDVSGCLFFNLWVDVGGCSSMCELTSMCEGDFKLVFTWCFIVIDAYIHIEDKTAGKIMKSM